jgi:hypothetical protein
MKKRNILLIIIFGTILLTPLTLGYFKIGENLVLDENRELAFKPKFGIYEKFPKYFSDYFNDHFGLRKQLIVANRWLRFKLFGVSPNKAISIGKENWLFYTPDVNYIDSVNAQGFSDSELEQIRNNLIGIQKEFEKRGIKFYFLVAPNKQSIYPEFLPSYMKKVRPDSRLDQLSRFLEKEEKINFINPKKELIEAKKEKNVYLKYDTHWNYFGAFTVYQKLFQRINGDFKEIKAKDLKDFETKTRTAPNNDLAQQMGVSGKYKEEELVFENKKPQTKIVLEDCPKIFTLCPIRVFEVDNSKLPKMLMFRDSFGTGLIPFMAEHFQRSYFYWGSIPFSTSIIEKENAKIIIFELTERELWRLKDKLFEFSK